LIPIVEPTDALPFKTKCRKDVVSRTMRIDEIPAPRVMPDELTSGAVAELQFKLDDATVGGVDFSCGMNAVGKSLSAARKDHRRLVTDGAAFQFRLAIHRQ